MKLKDRKVVLQVGTLGIVSELEAGKMVGLDVAFEIDKTVSANPNKSTIKIWGLNQDHQAEIHRAKGAKITLAAGYKEGTTVIFRGDLTNGQTVGESPETITTIETQDGLVAHQGTRCNLSFGKRTKVSEVLRAMASTLEANGVGRGNLDEAIKSAELEGVSGAFAGGFSVSGQATLELAKIVRSAGFEFSIQDGAIQITRRGLSLGRTALLLTTSSGLLSAPVRDAKGVVSAKVMMLPDLLPGRRVEFRGTETTGSFKIVGVKYTGSLIATEDFGAEIQCQEL